MASHRFARKPPAGLCSKWEAEDGIDPRLTPSRMHEKVTNRKALQLCRQVERILAGILEGEILRDMSVQSVIPGPDSSRLLATLIYHGDASIAITAVQAALHTSSGMLRSEIAHAIHRRKTPELTFNVVRS